MAGRRGVWHRRCFCSINEYVYVLLTDGFKVYSFLHSKFIVDKKPEIYCLEVLLMFLQNAFLAWVKWILIACVIGIVLETISGRKDNKRLKYIRERAMSIIADLKKTLREHDEITYNRLCDQAIVDGIDYTSRQEIVAYFTPFKRDGLDYPENGRYSDEYGYTQLWVIIYQEWAARHPEESKL